MINTNNKVTVFLSSMAHDIQPDLRQNTILFTTLLFSAVDEENYRNLLHISCEKQKIPIDQSILTQ